MVDEIIVSGSIILKEGKLLVIKENKDDFYKLPGGRVEGDETLEETCVRKVKEEINGEIILLKKLSPLILSENPTTHKRMRIELNHFLSELKNPLTLDPIEPIKEIKWLRLEQIKRKKYIVSPNITYLLERGELKI